MGISAGDDNAFASSKSIVPGALTNVPGGGSRRLALVPPPYSCQIASTGPYSPAA
jgi:hypothetical protein